MDGDNCYIDGVRQKAELCAEAKSIIEKVVKSGKPDGVIWIEYFQADGEPMYQVHFIDNGALTDEVRSRQPNLAQRF